MVISRYCGRRDAAGGWLMGTASKQQRSKHGGQRKATKRQRKRLKTASETAEAERRSSPASVAAADLLARVDQHEAAFRQRIAAGESFTTGHPSPTGSRLASLRLEVDGVADVQWIYHDDGEVEASLRPASDGQQP